MWKQHQIVRQRLVTAYIEEPRYVRWRLASGTVGMKDLLTNPELYGDVHDWVFLFQHCALKIQNEAVNESMGSCVATHAATQRHLSQEAIVKETFVHWNAQEPHKCDVFLKMALNLHFGSEKWHFISKDSRAKLHTVSEVVDRLMKKDSKLSFME